MSKFAVREAIEDDFPFIYSTWLKGLRFGNDVFNLIEQESYFKNYHRALEVILTRPDTRIDVACLIDDPATILGYAVLGDSGILHYVHVKQAFRRFGIARRLCGQDIHRVTHVTHMGWAILKEKFPKAVFDPFIT